MYCTMSSGAQVYIVVTKVIKMIEIAKNDSTLIVSEGGEKTFVQECVRTVERKYRNAHAGLKG